MRSIRWKVVAWVLGGLALVGLPAKQWVDGRDRIATLRAEESAALLQLEEINTELALVLGPQETERLARERLGMVRPGERAFVVADLAPPARPKAEVPRAESKRRWWSGSLRSLTRVFKSLI